MVKPFDVTKFRKSITKSIDGLGIGFNDPTDWISTGNHALNYLISGDFYKGIPLGKVTVFAGESGSGKSYICSGNIIREAQKGQSLLNLTSAFQDAYNIYSFQDTFGDDIRQFVGSTRIGERIGNRRLRRQLGRAKAEADSILGGDV